MLPSPLRAVPLTPPYLPMQAWVALPGAGSTCAVLPTRVGSVTPSCCVVAMRFVMDTACVIPVLVIEVAVAVGIDKGNGDINGDGCVKPISGDAVLLVIQDTQ